MGLTPPLPKVRVCTDFSNSPLPRDLYVIHEWPLIRSRKCDLIRQVTIKHETWVSDMQIAHGYELKATFVIRMPGTFYHYNFHIIFFMSNHRLKAMNTNKWNAYWRKTTPYHAISGRKKYTRNRSNLSALSTVGSTQPSTPSQQIVACSYPYSMTWNIRTNADNMRHTLVWMHSQAYPVQ